MQKDKSTSNVTPSMDHSTVTSGKWQPGKSHSSKHSNLTGFLYFIFLVFNVYVHIMKYQKILREGDYHNQLTSLFLTLKSEIEIEVSPP